MKVMSSILILVLCHQNPVGEWTRYTFEDYGFSIMGSQEFQVTQYAEDSGNVRTISYKETFRGEDVVSYVSMYQLDAYNDVPSGKDRDVILDAALEDLAFSLKMEIVYHNVVNNLGFDKNSFRLNSLDGERALKGRFILDRDRMYLVAMHYIPSMRLNKRSNFFIESFELL